MTALIDLLFTGYRRHVLGLLLLKPDQVWHVRVIARLTNTQPGTLHKELSKLAQAGIFAGVEQIAVYCCVWLYRQWQSNCQ